MSYKIWAIANSTHVTHVLRLKEVLGRAYRLLFLAI